MILVLSYWIHLLTTVVWLGGMAVMGLVALPAWRKQTLSDNQWFVLQERLTPWVNGSMVLLWITGFYQMTTDEHYTGFLAVDSTWAWAILLKHVAIILMMIIGLYIQLSIYPAVRRTRLLAQKIAIDEQETLAQREAMLLRLNLVCAGVVLLFTAIATAV